jgi:predicted metalloprotease
MRWKGGRRSTNVEDRRGQSASYIGAAAAAPAIIRFLPALIRSKLGRTILIVGVLVFVGGRLLGVDVFSLFLGGGGAGSGSSAEFSAQEQELAEFTSVILADTEDTWNAIFREQGADYREPTLVLYTGRVNSACGMATAAVGPFYCPGDQKLYVDLSFFHDLKVRHGVPGDFAQAYVIAHEVGHHVQTLLGISQQVQMAGRGRSKADVNALSVRQELQADCLAGLWGRSATTPLDPGDLEEALNAASAIGDDRLQREAGQRVVPDSFTHGSSRQRVRWFRVGFEGGSLADCDTFAARSL